MFGCSEAEEAQEFTSFLDKNTKIIEKYSEQKDIESRFQMCFLHCRCNRWYNACL